MQLSMPSKTRKQHWDPYSKGTIDNLNMIELQKGKYIKIMNHNFNLNLILMFMAANSLTRYFMT